MRNSHLHFSIMIRDMKSSPLFYGSVMPPAEPTDNKTNWSAHPEFPEGDISFLYEIPAIRCFKPISQQGPNSQPSNICIKIGDEGVHMNLWFEFREVNSLKKDTSM